VTINGAILLGGEERQRDERFQSVNPAIGIDTGRDYSESSIDDVAKACVLAAEAAEPFAALAPADRAALLEAIGESLLATGDVLIETAAAETGLPRTRLEGERGRTVGQLRMFAQELREGHWVDATIDPAMPKRAPPRADLRRMNVAVGPVAVFGASNFPLAFSVAGGDTASALAAGCPVVVKGHPAHPGTGELAARAIREAAEKCQLPAGLFSFLPGRENALGAALVADPRIKAVGFTGSRSGGMALVDIAQRRPEPIPVYAEMSSINPVVLLPAALAARAEELAKGFVASLTLGTGQFCTSPGVVIALDGADLDRFVAAASEALSGLELPPMLTSAICASYGAGVSGLESRAARIASGLASRGPNHCSGALFETTATAFLADSALGQEVFGPSSVIVRCRDHDDVMQVIAGLEGQLTATIHIEKADEALAARLLPLLREKAGRVLANGWPTGVEVTWAMVHGGPYPATSDGRTTSVGTLAMTRFLRPVCYQDIPDALLPPALQRANPWQLPRRVDGQWRIA